MHLKPFRETNHIKTSSLTLYHSQTATYLLFRKNPDPKQFKHQREKGIVLLEPPLSYLMKEESRWVVMV